MEDNYEYEKKTILIVDDEQKIVDLLVHNLTREGYNTIEANDGQTAINLALEKRPDLILLDVMLPRIDGLTVCKKIKNAYNVPILMVSAKDDELDKIVGLELGADDYISKPFAIEELLARIEVVFRRESNPKDSIFKFKDITIDTKSRIVKRNNEEINLTNKEYELLMILIENKDEVVTRDELLERIWGYDTETNVTDVYIRHLRSKLNNENKEEYIQTVRSIGYIMRS